ncbi:13703_t:CDS:1, partial [Acaulospora colombiana]
MALQTATQEDPLTRALRPLPEETPDQRTARLEAEALAKTISTEIDEYLRKEAQKRKEQKVKLLLL